MTKLGKYENTFGFDAQYLIEVQYVRHDRKRLRGEVTGKQWEHWRFGDKGLMHVADAALYIADGWMLPIDPEDFRQKLHAYQHPSALPPNTNVPRLMNLRDIKWIGATIADNLRENQIDTLEKLANLTPELLLQYAGERNPLNVARATEAIAEARKVIGWEPKEQSDE